MNGCRWQEKHFSVAVEEKPSYVCYECKNSCDNTYKHNGDILCKECFSKKPSRICLGEFNTHKDLKYGFVTDMTGKPVLINSQGQYKKLLKKNGMVDASPKECRQEADFRKRLNTEDNNRQRKKTATEMFLKNRKELTFRRG